VFDVRTEFDAVFFKRSMTLSYLRTLSEGDTIKFQKTAFEKVKLCPKDSDEGSVGYLDKSNRFYAVPFPAENKAETADAMDIELLDQSI
jgi:flagellar motor switch protein FliM